MGFFDFLHGVSNQKSEAELYMEKRNKEYAKRAAAYRRREAMLVTQSGLDGFSKLFNSIQQQNNYTQPMNNRSTQQNIQQSQQAVCQTSAQLHNKKSTSSCGECGNENSIYDSKNLDIFVVENAFTKAETQTVTASGNIVRGGFSVGDKVEIATTLETRTVIIQKMLRRGEAIQYANTSSGKIAIILSNAADILVRKDDTITKKKR